MNLRRRSFFKTCAAAIVIGTAKASQDLGLTKVKDIIDVPVKGSTKQSSMLSFAERCAKIYGGEFHGKTFIREDFGPGGLEALAEQLALNSPDLLNPTQQSVARCPSCDAQLMLGALDLVDVCPICNHKLRVVHQSIILPERTREGQTLPKQEIQLKRFILV